MADLSVSLGPLELKNPMVAASAITTKTIERAKKAEACGIAAIIAKAVVTRHPYFALPRFYTDPGKRGLYCPMDPRLEGQEGLDFIKALKKEVSVPVIANTMGSGNNIDSWVEIASKLADAGADMIELNLACPNIGLMQKTLGQLSGDEEEVLGAIVGQNPSLAGRIVKAVKDSIKKPIMAKLTPEAADISAVARAVLENGASVLDVTNAPAALPGVDVYNDGKPLHKGFNTQSFSGVCGPYMKPFTLKNVAQIKLSNPGAEILASGGLMNWKDSVEAIMVGAKAAAYCTLIMWKGWEVLRDIEKELREYMEQQGYSRLQDFYCAGLKYISTPNQVSFRYVAAQVDAEKCTGCGICVKPGHCEAIELRDEIAYVNKELCVGCDTCADLCPAGAITMVEDDEIRAEVLRAREIYDRTH
jgi:dihydroorotate dehydrogenase/Pyruvate/2-oxoacid:ferredoxin oxidoreductase delta subunit